MLHMLVCRRKWAEHQWHAEHTLIFGEEEVMDEDTQGSEEDNDDMDEEVDASTWHCKFKGKGKAKMSKPKLKMQAAHLCMGVGGADSELGLQHIADEATGEAGNSMPGVKTGPSKSMQGSKAGSSNCMPSPEPIPMYVHTIVELQAMLPQFSGEAYGIMDKMNPEADPEIEALKLSDMPDMIQYIELVLDWASRQADALQEMDPIPS